MYQLILILIYKITKLRILLSKILQKVVKNNKNNKWKNKHQIFKAQKIIKDKNSLLVLFRLVRLLKIKIT